MTKETSLSAFVLGLHTLNRKVSQAYEQLSFAEQVELHQQWQSDAAWADPSSVVNRFVERVDQVLVASVEGQMMGADKRAELIDNLQYMNLAKKVALSPEQEQEIVAANDYALNRQPQPQRKVEDERKFILGSSLPLKKSLHIASTCV